MKAIIIIDVQEAYVGHRRADAQYQQAMSTINDAASQFRQRGLPVVVVRDLSEGTDSEFNNVRELVTEPTDIRIAKMFNNSFWQTALDKTLKAKGVDWVLLCGNAAEFCVDATYFGALEHGYTTQILQGGVLAETPEGLTFTEAVRPLLPLAELPAVLADA